MKIIIVGPAHPIRGGISDTNEAMCRAFKRRGHEASIVSFSLQYPNLLFPGKTQYREEAAPEGIRIESRINSINPLNWFKVARYINQCQADIVIFRYWIPYMAMCMGVIARKLSSTIVRVALCDNVMPHESRLGDANLTRFFVRPFDGFITLSQAVAAELNDFTSKPKLYFPHPINDKLGKRVPREIAAEKLKLDPTREYILFFGLIRKYKGVDLLINAMSDAWIKDQYLDLLIVGEFYEPIEEYQDLIAELGLTDRVIIHNDFIPSSDIKYYFSIADIVGQTYRSASQSGVTQVAFNFDVPVLTTDVGGLSEIIETDVTGYVVSPNVESISQAIVRHFKSGNQAELVKNIQLQKSKFSWDSFVLALEGFYKQLNC